MRFIKDIQEDLAGKTVLLRTDLNAESVDDSLKLEKALDTIRFLLERGAKVVLLSHRGRPTKEIVVGGDIPEEFSLRFVLPFLEEELGATVNFLSDFDFAAHQKIISAAATGSLFVLENVRLHPGENAVDREYAKQLASLGDLYVNDAFGSWHPGVTITELPKLLPGYAGLLMQAELEHLAHVMDASSAPRIVILGGGKAADKFSVIKNLYDRTDAFLIGGILANTFLKARGTDVGSSIIDEEIVQEVNSFSSDAKIILPTDFVRDNDGKILDIGEQGRKLFCEHIALAKTVIWNGPLGYFEEPAYRAGSEAVAKAIAAADNFAVVGGGETTQLILELGMDHSFTWLSTGGGAMLAYLAGKKLVGLEALGYYQ